MLWAISWGWDKYNLGSASPGTQTNECLGRHCCPLGPSRGLQQKVQVSLSKNFLWLRVYFIQNLKGAINTRNFAFQEQPPKNEALALVGQCTNSLALVGWPSGVFFTVPRQNLSVPHPSRFSSLPISHWWPPKLPSKSNVGIRILVSGPAFWGVQGLSKDSISCTLWEAIMEVLYDTRKP